MQSEKKRQKQDQYKKWIQYSINTRADMKPPVLAEAQPWGGGSQTNCGK